jgi:hypothetical protein
VNAASAVQVAAKDSCARRRPRFRAVAEKTRPDVRSRSPAQPEAAEPRATDATRQEDHDALTFGGRLADA